MRLAFLFLFALLFALSTALAGCTETPSYFPPCVDPYTPCAAPEAGADASDGGMTDALGEATIADAPGEAAASDAP